MNENQQPIDMTDPKPSQKPVRTPITGFAKGPVYIPASLRFVTWDYSKSSADRISSFGKWNIRILKQCSLGMGVTAEPGQTYTVTGDTARLLVELGQAKFVDAKLMEEKEILEKADAIRKTSLKKREPERFSPSKPKGNWLTGVIHQTPANA